MQFSRDDGRPRGVWADRGVDEYVDSYALCDPCNDRLEIEDAIREARSDIPQAGSLWHDESVLCGHCRDGFDVHAEVVDTLDLPRPFNMDRAASFEANMGIAAREMAHADYVESQRLQASYRAETEDMVQSDLMDDRFDPGFGL